MNFIPLSRAGCYASLALFFCLHVTAAGAMEKELGQTFRLNLTEGWTFKPDPNNSGIKENWMAESGSDGSWQKYELPDYWTRHLIRHEEPGTRWFTNNFILSDRGESLLLYVSGIDNDATFFLNGKEIGKSSGYSEDVSFEVGKYASVGNNRLAVRLNRTVGTEKIYGPISLVQKSSLPAVTRQKISIEYARKRAKWVEDAVIYELYPRSFSKDESFKSVIKAIPELKKMGVTVIWLMPINPIGKLHRKGSFGSPYSIQDYYKINPEYGTLDDLESLVKAVHESGLHIIIDLVINHTAWDNPLIREHPDWYKHDRSGNIIAPNPDWTDVAQLDYSRPALRQYMIDMIKYWVRDVGIDGFRCDVAEMVPLDFWNDARTALDSIKPVMMLAEGSRPAMHLKAFDLTYAWNIYDVLGKIFEGTTRATAIDSVLDREAREFPSGSLRLRFKTNHDKNAFDAPSIERYGAAGDSLTAALIATLPGVPLVYNGDEVGNPERLSLFEQVPIDWTVKNGFSEFYKEILQIRRTHDALLSGEYHSLATSDPRDVFAFERRTGNSTVVCVFNFSKQPLENFEVDIEDASSPVMIDALSGNRIHLTDHKLALTLKARGFAILSAP